MKKEEIINGINKGILTFKLTNGLKHSFFGQSFYYRKWTSNTKNIKVIIEEGVMGHFTYLYVNNKDVSDCKEYSDVALSIQMGKEYKSNKENFSVFKGLTKLFPINIKNDNNVLIEKINLKNLAT